MDPWFRIRAAEGRRSVNFEGMSQRSIVTEFCPTVYRFSQGLNVFNRHFFMVLCFLTLEVASSDYVAGKMFWIILIYQLANKSEQSGPCWDNCTIWGEEYWDQTTVDFTYHLQWTHFCTFSSLRGGRLSETTYQFFWSMLTVCFLFFFLSFFLSSKCHIYSSWYNNTIPLLIFLKKSELHSWTIVGARFLTFNCKTR